MLPRNELPEDHRLLGNEAFAGFRLFCNWRDLQPEMHTLDWSRVDLPIKRAKAYDQKIFISINFGKGRTRLDLLKPASLHSVHVRL